jgi:hypothetical protein
MFFILSKIFWLFINPSNLFVIMLIGGWGLLWKKQRLGRGVLLGEGISLLI